MNTPTVGIIVSVFNENEIIEKFHTEISNYLFEKKINATIYYVNDGSSDNTLEILLKLKNNGITVINFSRNFGHEAAMLAGLDNAKEDALIFIDGDLQHPIEKIEEMLTAFSKGAEIVKMQRVSREDGGILKKITSKLFYKI